MRMRDTWWKICVGCIVCMLCHGLIVRCLAMLIAICHEHVWLFAPLAAQQIWAQILLNTHVHGRKTPAWFRGHAGLGMLSLLLNIMHRETCQPERSSSLCLMLAP